MAAVENLLGQLNKLKAGSTLVNVKIKKLIGIPVEILLSRENLVK
jgi:hypothetical protein